MALPLQEHIEKDGFRLRGLEVTRVDAFSDVVFGFALTLLVVSLEVPKTYAALHDALRGFVPFAISFTFLMLIWYAHYKFFRRFGLHDAGTIAINAVLLFFVLFYVYPLKFLFTFVTAWLSGADGGRTFRSDAEIQELMVVYGLGFAAIYLLLAALYWNAWRQRERLKLNGLERILLQGYVLDLVGTASVGLLSCIVAKALPARLAGLSGWTYVLISGAARSAGAYTRRRVAAWKKQQASVEIDAAKVDADGPVPTPNAHS